MFQATAARALESCVTLLTEPKDMPPPYQGTSILICGRPSPRRFSSMLVSISSFGTLDRRLLRELEPELVEAAAGVAASRYSNPYSVGGTSPVSAIFQVARIMSAVQR